MLFLSFLQGPGLFSKSTSLEDITEFGGGRAGPGEAGYRCGSSIRLAPRYSKRTVSHPLLRVIRTRSSTREMLR